VVGTASRALISDHCGDAVTVGSLDRDASTAVGGIVPVGGGKSSSVDSRRKSVLCE
jgi:hypothetical protein